MPAVAAIVLAAGRSSRFRAAGGKEPSKLVAEWRGEALVRHVVRSAAAAGLDPVIVVTGHAQSEVESAIAGFDVLIAPNPRYADGLATSLAAGIAAVPAEASAALILLGDMPLVPAAALRALVEAAEAPVPPDAVVPISNGARRNPVLLGRSLFARAARLSGDEGARKLLRDPALLVREIVIDDPALQLDIDDPDALARANRA